MQRENANKGWDYAHFVANDFFMKICRYVKFDVQDIFRFQAAECALDWPTFTFLLHPKANGEDTTLKEYY